MATAWPSSVRRTVLVRQRESTSTSTSSSTSY